MMTDRPLLVSGRKGKREPSQGGERWLEGAQLAGLGICFIGRLSSSLKEGSRKSAVSALDVGCRLN